MRFLLRITVLLAGLALLMMSASLLIARRNGPSAEAAWIVFVNRTWKGGNDTTLQRVLPSGHHLDSLHPAAPMIEAVSAHGSKVLYAVGKSIEWIEADHAGARHHVTTGSQPAWSPDGKLIAFTTDEGLHTIRPDGQGKRLLAAGVTGYTSWSPDSIWLTYSADGNIFRVRVDDGTLEQLTSGKRKNSFPRWATSGDWIVYVSEDGGDTSIYRMRPDGSESERLTSGLNALGFPAWSPDGQQIAFVVQHITESGVYLMRADGRQIRRLPGRIYSYWPPAWSADSRSLIVALQDNSTSYDLYRIHVDQQGIEQIIDLPSEAALPLWMPVPRRDGYGLAVLVGFGVGIVILSFQDVI